MKLIAWQRQTSFITIDGFHPKESWSCAHIIDDFKPTYTLCGMPLPEIGKEGILRFMEHSPRNTCTECVVRYGRITTLDEHAYRAMQQRYAEASCRNTWHIWGDWQEINGAKQHTCMRCGIAESDQDDARRNREVT